MVSGFLKSSSHNLRYIGIDSLARIVHINAKYAAEHQLAVIDCLEDPDDTLKKKTLELLYKMTKPSNVEVRASSLCIPPSTTPQVGLDSVLHRRLKGSSQISAPGCVHGIPACLFRCLCNDCCELRSCSAAFLLLAPAAWSNLGLKVVRLAGHPQEICSPPMSGKTA